MNLRDLMANDAQRIVSVAGEGEAATYHFAAGGLDRDILVIVRRETVSDFGGDPRDTATVQEAQVWVPYNALNGITAFEDGDEMTVALRHGQAPVRCRVVEALSSDAMGFLLRVIA